MFKRLQVAGIGHPGQVVYCDSSEKQMISRKDGGIPADPHAGTLYYLDGHIGLLKRRQPDGTRFSDTPMLLNDVDPKFQPWPPGSSFSCPFAAAITGAGLCALAACALYASL